LINGKGRYLACVDVPEGEENLLCDRECTADNYLASIQVEPGKTYRFRLINAATLVAVNLVLPITK
jgi:Multicopper oxidase